MLLTIAADIPASELGYLLHKNPARFHSFDLSFGKAHVFYPKVGSIRSEAALLLDVDPVGLVRGRSHTAEAGLHQYVNDRPYIASSFLSVAMSQVFGTAMSGRSKERQELADQPIQFDALITALPCRGGSELLKRLFEPLGYESEAKGYHLDEHFPEWGTSPYYTVRLRNHVRLRDLLTHMYVLIPVLDAEKHYWVGEDEVEKLLRKGEGWLADHPERQTIVNRYLRYDRKLTRSALGRLVEGESNDPEAEDIDHTQEERSIEAPLKLWEQRIGSITSALRSREAQTVVDLGCGEGKLLSVLLHDRSFERIVGVDVSWRALEIASKRLHLDQLPIAQRSRIELLHGSLMYKDKRVSGFDAAVVAEVIEHLDRPRLAAFERVVFEHARPGMVLVTTPNAEYNPLFPFLPSGRFRHKDHRFEWTRSEFQRWAMENAERFGYKVRFLPIGTSDPIAGPPTQMGVFER
ncbi:MAG: 3' terminal RNA ribose 2'-O-methyltransferase Hen1 [Acidobacteriaceae bacterium]|nr:3' terminal RNA ribose 2'-O-methyltransferase Hen1 [Acidobacteriaceae bacterium]